MQNTKLQISKRKSVDGITRKATTFDYLLKKYKGKIMQATENELRSVKPNGLKELFAALHRYQENEKHLRECKCCSLKPNLTS